MMQDQAGLDGRIDDYVGGLKGRPPADPRFKERVMDAVRAWEASRPEAAGTAPAPRRGRPAAAPSPWRGLLGWWRAPGPRIAFASLLVLALAGTFRHALLTEAGTGVGAASPDTRIKGAGFRIGFLLKREGAVGPAEPGGIYRPGDRLQAVYSAESAGRLRLFALAADGSAACLTCGARDSLLPAGQDRMTPFALELDASPGREVLAGFWSGATGGGDPAPAGLDRILEEAGRTAGADPGALGRALAARLPPGVSFSLFPLVKEAPSHDRP